MGAEIQPPFWICSPPPTHTHTGRWEHLLLLYSILNRCQHGRDRNTADRSTVDQRDRLNTLRTVPAILPDTWTRQPKLTWSAHLPTSEQEGVTLSWGDEQLVRRGSSKRRSDGRQQAHGTAPPVRSAITHRLAYSTPSLSRSRCLSMQTGMLANSHTKLVTIYGYYILWGREGKSLYLHVIKGVQVYAHSFLT